MPSRRQFLKVLSAAFGGLVVSAHHKPWHTKGPPGSSTTTTSTTTTLTASAYSDVYEESYA